MTNVVQAGDLQTMPILRGHTTGFVDTDAECEAAIHALNERGFPISKIKVFRGDEGLLLLEGVMDASSWGESAEAVLKQARIELGSGHSVILVDVLNADEAATVAAVSSQHGAHGIYHFGVLVDTRLTA